MLTAEEIKNKLLDPEVKGLVNITTLERRADIPKYSLVYYLSGRSKTIAAEHLPKITTILQKLNF